MNTVTDLAAVRTAAKFKFPPFVVDKKMPDGRGRCFWQVEPTGNYTDDCITGRRLALEYLESLQSSLLLLQWIVSDMPADQSGIEIAFLGTVSRAATLPDSMLQALRQAMAAEEAAVAVIMAAEAQ